MLKVYIYQNEIHLGVSTYNDPDFTDDPEEFIRILYRNYDAGAPMAFISTNAEGECEFLSLDPAAGPIKLIASRV